MFLLESRLYGVGGDSCELDSSVIGENGGRKCAPSMAMGIIPPTLPALEAEPGVSGLAGDM